MKEKNASIVYRIKGINDTAKKGVGIQIIFTFLRAIQDNDVRNHDGATSLKYLLEG